MSWKRQRLSVASRRLSSLALSENSCFSRRAELGLQTTLLGPRLRYVGTLPVAGNANAVVRSGCAVAAAGGSRARVAATVAAAARCLDRIGRRRYERRPVPGIDCVEQILVLAVDH